MTATAAFGFLDSPDDYVAFMRDPARVVRLEWRKVRRTESKGLTSHSWLEVRQLDGKRWRLELYSDRGYTEMASSPDCPCFHFFDSKSTIYDGRVAESQDFVRPLTGVILRDRARAIAALQPYSISEFNCHHFVLELWNEVVIEPLRSSHYPDRAKTSMLWGLEGALSTWFENFGSASNGQGSLQSLGAPNQGALAQHAGPSGTHGTGDQGTNAPFGEQHFGKVVGVLEDFSAVKLVVGDRPFRLERFCQHVRNGVVYLVEPGQQGRRLVRMSLQASGHPEDLCAQWAESYFPGMEASSAYESIELIGGLQLPESIDRIFRLKDSETKNNDTSSSLMTPSLLSSFSSLSSLQANSQEAYLTRDPLADTCFVLLKDGRRSLCGVTASQLRLACYAVLRPAGAPGACAWRLRLSVEKASRIRYWLGDLPEMEPTTVAADVARQDLLEEFMECRGEFDPDFVDPL